MVTKEEDFVPEITSNETKKNPFKGVWRKILKGIASGLIVQEKLDNKNPDHREIMVNRRTACNGCKYRDKQADMCKVCGCFLELKIASKTNLDPRLKKVVVTHCPKGLWDDKEISDFYDKKKS